MKVALRVNTNSCNEKIYTVETQSPEQTCEVAESIATQFPNALILLNGSMGAGKTLFTKGFVRGLGIDCQVSSPSYTLINEYRSNTKSLYHLDLYRIDCFEEVVDIGLFEILENDSPCLIEWAERVEELKKLPHLLVVIEQPDIENEYFRRLSWQWKEGQI